MLDLRNLNTLLARQKTAMIVTETSLSPGCIFMHNKICASQLIEHLLCVHFLPQIAQSGLSENVAFYFNDTFVSSLKLSAFRS